MISGGYKEAVFGVCIYGKKAGKPLRITKHDAKIRERMIHAAAGHSQNAEIAVPLSGRILQRFFEIVVLLIGDVNDLGAALFIVAAGFQCDGIEIANDSVAWGSMPPRMFRAAIGADNETGVRGIIERSFGNLAAKNNESECVQN